MGSKLVWDNGRFVRTPSEFERTAVVSYADGRYTPVVNKLLQSVQIHNPGLDVFVFRTPQEIGSPPHSHNPYAFKVYAIQKVRDMGYTTILWCDSCLRAVRSLVPLIHSINTHGVYLQKDGWPCGRWANDRALEYYGVTRDQAMDITSVYACFMAFNFKTEIANKFFDQWKRACQMGIFIGRWENNAKTESQDERCTGHRHDQTCAELTAYTLQIPIQPRVLLSATEVNARDRFFTSWDKP
jgi:hypothetical protein